jgi:hypothetical protein
MKKFTSLAFLCAAIILSVGLSSFEKDENTARK